MSLFDDLARHALNERRDKHLLRSRKLLTHFDATHVDFDGQRLVNFSSNNYLGLTHHPRMLAAAKLLGACGAGAAGLISGFTREHYAAEQALAQWKQTEAALLMPSGYQANIAAIQTLFAVAESQNRHVRFLIDKLAHASLIDAVRLTGAPMRVFPHNGIDKLARLLSEADANEVQVVVTESIFSMDGDAADLAAIAGLKAKFDFVLMVDEAHGSGIYGPGGAGLVAELGLRDSVDVAVVTLSKALGFAGGAICARQTFIDTVLNFGRAYVYSTAVAPLTGILTQTAIRVLADEPERQARVRAIARGFRERLRDCGVQLLAGDSPIIPIPMDDESAAISEAQRLRDQGFLVLPIRPPTVPRGTSRLRITVSSEHTDHELDRLAGCIRPR